MSEKSKQIVCPMCDGTEVKTSYETHKFDYGAGDDSTELTATIPIRQCVPCEYEFIDYNGEEILHDTVCKHLGVLTPSEIRNIRKGMHMSRSQFSQFSGLGEASLNRWENGKCIQSLANDKYLRLLGKTGKSDLMDILGTKAKENKKSPSLAQIFPALGEKAMKLKEYTFSFDDVYQAA